jgi:hypothetical protein
MENNKKENKPNYVLIVLCVLVGILIIVLLSTKTNKSEIQQQDTNPVANIPSNTVVGNTVKTSSPTPSIDLQTKCATQAQILLRDYRQEQNGVTINKTNHFNNKLQKCLINFSTLDNVAYVLGSEVRDAYENKVLVSCHSGGPIKEKICDIPAISSSTGSYQRITKEAGEEMIKSYMNE